MNPGNLPPPSLITRPAELHSLVESLRREPVLAVDTESNSLYAYREQVCLMQFSSPQGDYLVDPLALEDLSPLGSLFSDPAIESVFHAAEYDLICLNRDFGFEFARLFDTMVAARILGREAVGLGAMLKAEFGVKMNKRHQRANWGQRPLPAYLLDYARLDTHYLIALRQRLEKALRQRDLLALAHEDFERLRTIRWEQNESASAQDKDAGCWRVSGSFDLKPQQAAVLNELCHYRERKAQALDRPLFKVIGDKTLLCIAERTPDSLEELRQIPGMSPRQVKRHGAPVLRAVRRGLRAEPLYPPRTPRPDGQFLARLEALRQWRKEAARKMGVKSDVVLPRDLLLLLAKAGPRNADELAGALTEVPWRLERFGDQILAVLSHT